MQKSDRDFFEVRPCHNAIDRRIVENMNARERAYKAQDLDWAGYYTAIIESEHKKKKDKRR